MAIQNLDWWYDKQMYRFLQQLVRAFSGFQYQTGYNANGSPQLVLVPCTYANTNRQVANIIRNNSENMLNAAPRISIWQSGLTGRREDVQYPGYVDTQQVVTQTGTGNKSNSYTVQRMMPLPFQMEINVDIWTTNLDQKYQLLEQILTVIYPGFDIQNSQNPLDWTALTNVYVEDITLSSRNVPIGTDSDIDIASIRLRVPIWLSPPTKVKTQTIITQIITNIFDDIEIDMDGYGGPSGADLTTVITTPDDHWINVSGSTVTLLGKNNADPGDGQDYTWNDLLNSYGLYKPTISSLQLYYTNDLENNFVSGVFQIDPSAPNQLIWQVDPATVPVNTLSQINAMIDPLKTFPGSGLPLPTEGTRYLIANDIGPSSLAWGNVTAYENDIIEYVNGTWVVAFSSKTSNTTQLIVNAYTGSQLKWTGQVWSFSIDNNYPPGYWRLKL